MRVRKPKIKIELGARSSLSPNPASFRLGQYELDGKSKNLQNSKKGEKIVNRNPLNCPMPGNPKFENIKLKNLATKSPGLKANLTIEKFESVVTNSGPVIEPKFE